MLKYLVQDLGNLPQEISNGLEAIKELDGIVKSISFTHNY